MSSFPYFVFSFFRLFVILPLRYFFFSHGFLRGEKTKKFHAKRRNNARRKDEKTKYARRKNEKTQDEKTTKLKFQMASFRMALFPFFVFKMSPFRLVGVVFLHGVISSFCMTFFRLFVFSHDFFRTFRLFAWRLFFLALYPTSIIPVMRNLIGLINLLSASFACYA